MRRVQKLRGDRQMKSVLISIRPQWCELIASGKKTIEVRKSAPKEVPFKVYMYETKAGFIEAVRGTCPKCAFSRGKIISEFVCDKVDQIIEATAGICFADKDFNILDGENELKKTCLSVDELANYLGEDENGLCKNGYAWHISDLKIYDKPKELSDFSKYGYKYLGGCCVNNNCKNYVYNGYYQPPECKIDGCFLKRPPQSWMYVEELQ